MALLVCEHLSMSYPCGTAALQDVSFALEPGQRVAVLGANGAGKSSLLGALVGLNEASGSVRVNGVALQKETLVQVRRALGFVFQNPDDQLFSATVAEDVAFGPLNAGKTAAEAAAAAQQMLETLGVGHLAQKAPYRMSGGEKRMAALAGVLVLQPQALLLDEPTAFLDPRARRTLLHVLRRRPEAMVVATHDLDFALDLCTHAVLLHHGCVVAQGEARALLTDAEQLQRAGLELPLRFQTGEEEL